MNEELKVIISAEIAKLKKGMDDAKKQVKGFSDKAKSFVKDYNDEFQKVGDVSKKALATVGVAVAGVATSLLALSTSTQDYRNEQAKLVTAFESAGGSAETAKNTYNDLYRVLGDSGQATEAAQSLARITTEEKALGEYTTILTGIYATYGEGMPIETLSEAISETIACGTVTGDLSRALVEAGISEDNFNKKLQACNSESEREKLIRQTLNGVYSDASAKYEKNSSQILAQNDAQRKLDDTMASLGETVAPIVEALKELASDILTQLQPYIQEFADKYLPSITEALSGVGEKIGEVITWIADNWELVSTLAVIILGIATALTVFSTVMGIVNAVMMASPVTWIVLAIVAAIAALVAIIVVVIKHWDDIKKTVSNVVKSIKEKVKEMVDKVAKWFSDMKEKISSKVQEAKTAVVNKFNEIKTGIQDKVQSVKTAVVNKFQEIKTGIQDKIQGAVQGAVDKFNSMKSKVTSTVSGIVSGVKNKFGEIKSGITEKINSAKDAVKSAIDKIKGFFKFKWSLPKLKLPKISISGKFSIDPPQVPKFSIKWNKLGGVFDKPTLFSYGNSLQGLGEDGAEAVVPLEKNTQWLSKLADMLNERMGGGTPIILQVDGKTFAQTSINSINQLTKQQGKLGLNLV